METVFIAHAPRDQAAARALAAFLERGTRARVFVEEGAIGPTGTLLEKVRDGQKAHAIIALLSSASVPRHWVREEWVPVFRDEPKEGGIRVAAVQLEPCNLPDLLRRNDFFDGRGKQRDWFRALKRWLLAVRTPLLDAPFAPGAGANAAGREGEVEALRCALADRPGHAAITGPPGCGKTALALAFAKAAFREFEGVAWVCCGGRSEAGIAGALAAQFGLDLRGDLNANRAALARFCAEHRLLVVLDDAPEAELPAMLAGGRASVLVTAAESGGLAIELSALPETAAGDAAPECAAALAACAPGMAAALACEVAGCDEETLVRLAARGILLEVNANGPEYTVPHAVRAAVQPDRTEHAAAVCRLFGRWSADPGMGATLLPQAWHALRDPACPLALDLARGAFAAAVRANRLAEAFEFLEAMESIAETSGDQRALADASRERVWVLEGWGRHDEALAAHRQWITESSGQLSLDLY